ncbi:MAG TPA: RidA family protein [Thermomicrobiales bacterium]|jgi:enamine deaminase RidA (YjgF/YER057c/UK114 family)|nr:RidA family protein [Thermomicrobiales bacterium]
MGRIDDRLAELGITLPETVNPVATYTRYILDEDTGRLLISGTGPVKGGPVGQVDADVTVEQAVDAARECGLQIIATVREALGGDLDRVVRVMKVLGMVNSSTGFGRQPLVINGCTDLFVEVFGPEAGLPTRSAVGMGELPDRIPVEIEAEFKVR